MSESILLDRRRLRAALQGFPKVDPETGEVVGLVEQEMIGVADLAYEDQVELGRRVYEALAEAERRRERGDYALTDAQTYAIVLADHGVRCPHPPQHRQPIAPHAPGYECLACGCWVVPARNEKAGGAVG